MKKLIISVGLIITSLLATDFSQKSIAECRNGSSSGEESGEQHRCGYGIGGEGEGSPTTS